MMRFAAVLGVIFAIVLGATAIPQVEDLRTLTLSLTGGIGAFFQRITVTTILMYVTVVFLSAIGVFLALVRSVRR